MPRSKNATATAAANNLNGPGTVDKKTTRMCSAEEEEDARYRIARTRTTCARSPPGSPPPLEIVETPVKLSVSRRGGRGERAKDRSRSLFRRGYRGGNKGEKRLLRRRAARYCGGSPSVFHYRRKLIRFVVRTQARPVTLSSS